MDFCPSPSSAGRRATLVALLCLAGVGPLRVAAAATGTPSTVVPPLSYDARTLAMGGAGVALTESGAAGLNNPALVGLTRQARTTATFSPYVLRLRAPFTFANGEVAEIQSGALFGPFSQLGINVRLNRRVVVGMLASVSAAAGGVFERIPLSSLSEEAPKGIIGNATVAQVAGELRIPVAVQVAPWLHLAAAYRLTAGYALAKIAKTNGTMLSEASLRGTNVLGFGLGALALVGPRVRLGLAYRSQTSVDVSGTLKTYAGKKSTEAGLSRRKAINTPHDLKVGATWRVPAAEALLLACELRFSAYQLLNKQERNVFGAGLGAEYNLRPWVALRLGYSISTQPTRRSYATAFAAPPGLGHGTLVGTGLRLGDWLIDATLGYLRSGTRIPSGPRAGAYQVRGLVASASASYAI